VIALGKKEALYGLTKKAVVLDRGMRAAWSEMVVQADEEEVLFEAGALEALSNLFDRVWAHVGQERSPLKTAIMDVLSPGPQTADEIYAAVVAGPDDGEESEFKDLRRPEFDRAFHQLLEGGILTARQREMWVID